MIMMKQGVALTGRNTTGQPCSVGRPSRRQRYRRRQTTTDASQQCNTGPLGRPVITNVLCALQTVIIITNVCLLVLFCNN